MKVQIYLPDELGECVKARDELNVSAVCQAALSDELSRLDRLAKLGEGFKDVEVDLMDGDYLSTVVFTGRLLASREWQDDYRAAIYLTGRKRIAMVTTEGFSTGVLDFDSIQDAIDKQTHLVRHLKILLSEAALELGERIPVRLDI